MNKLNTNIPQSPSNGVILGFSAWLLLNTVARYTHTDRQTDGHTQTLWATVRT